MRIWMSASDEQNEMKDELKNDCKCNKIVVIWNTSTSMVSTELQIAILLITACQVPSIQFYYRYVGRLVLVSCKKGPNTSASQFFEFENLFHTNHVGCF